MIPAALLPAAILLVAGAILLLIFGARGFTLSKRQPESPPEAQTPPAAPANTEPTSVELRAIASELRSGIYENLVMNVSSKLRDELRIITQVDETFLPERWPVIRLNMVYVGDMTPASLEECIRDRVRDILKDKPKTFLVDYRFEYPNHEGRSRA